MASVNPNPQSQYEIEAGTFLSTMGEMAPQMALDYSVDSLQRLDQFISDHFEKNDAATAGEVLITRVGAYLGEVIIRHLGGYWNPDGKPEVNDIGPIEAIFPIEKAVKRFQNGREDSLAWYYHALVKQAYEAELKAVSNEKAPSGNSGFMGLFKGLFGK